MNERKRVEVNEEALQQIMAVSKETYLTDDMIKPVLKEPQLPVSSENEPEPEQPPQPAKAEAPASENDPNKGQKKRKNPKSDFAERFLKERFVKNKKQIYISVEVFNMIRSYLKYMGDVSFIAYVDNILLRHIEENKEEIMEMFDKNVCKPSFNNL
jgi:hypothetical protein